MSGDTQVQPKGFYHLAQAGREGIHGKSLAAMLMQTFQHILDDFKAGMHQHIDQTKYLSKLLHDVAKLTTLINEVTNPDVSISSLAQEITSQGAIVEGDIGELSNSVFKTELEKAFQPVLAILKSQIKFKAVAHWYRDLKRFQAWQGKVNWDDGGRSGYPSEKAAAQALISILKDLNVDMKQMKGLIKQFEKNNPGIASALQSFYNKADTVWENILSICGGEWHIFERASCSKVLGYADRGDDSEALKCAERLVDAILTNNPRDPNLLYPVENFVYTQNLVDNAIKEKRPTFKISLAAFLEIARKVMDPTNTAEQALFPGVYDEMTSIEDGLDRMNVQGTSISEQTTTQFYQTMATVTALIKKISAMANIPIQIVSSEINNITKHH